jgi:hypothetical protein
MEIVPLVVFQDKQAARLLSPPLYVIALCSERDAAIRHVSADRRIF